MTFLWLSYLFSHSNKMTAIALGIVYLQECVTSMKEKTRWKRDPIPVTLESKVTDVEITDSGGRLLSLNSSFSTY